MHGVPYNVNCNKCTTGRWYLRARFGRLQGGQSLARKHAAMRLSLRFVIPLALALAALAYAVTPLVDRLTLRWFTRDLELRSTLIAGAIDGPLSSFVSAGYPLAVQQYFTRIVRDERLYGIGLCVNERGRIVASPEFPVEVQCDGLKALEAAEGKILNKDTGPLLVSVVEVPVIGAESKLIMLHDMS